MKILVGWFFSVVAVTILVIYGLCWINGNLTPLQSNNGIEILDDAIVGICFLGIAVIIAVTTYEYKKMKIEAVIRANKFVRGF